MAAFTLFRELDEYPTGAKRRKLLMLAVLASLICSYEAAIAPVVPLLLVDLHMSLTTYGLIAAASLAFGAVAGIISGPLSDRVGRVRILVPLMALTAILAFLMAFVGSTTSFAVLRFVLAFVEGMAVATTAPLVRDFSPRMGRAQAMGFWACGPVGANFISAGIAAISLPLFHNAWESQFIIIGILSLCASVVIALNIADLSPKLRAEVLETERRVLDQADEQTKPRASTLLKRPLVWVHLVGISIWLLFYLTLTAYGQTIMVQSFGKTESQASLIMTMFWVLNLIALVAVGRWSDRIRVRRTFLLVFSIISIALTLVFAVMMGDSTSSTVALVLTGALTGGAMGAAYSPWMAQFSEFAEDLDPRLQGVAWGMFSFFTRVLAMVVVIFGPVLVAATGSWRAWTFVCAGGMVAFTLAVPWLKGPWRRTRETVEAEPAVIGANT